MKSLIINDTKILKYRGIAIFLILVALTYIISDLIEWVNNKGNVVLGIQYMPFPQRLLSYFFSILLGYGGFLLIIRKKKSWYFIVISLLGYLSSFLIIPIVWNIFFYTNWLEDLPFFLWYIVLFTVLVYFIIKHKDFEINYLPIRILVIVSIVIGVRYMYEYLISNLIMG